MRAKCYIIPEFKKENMCLDCDGFYRKRYRSPGRIKTTGRILRDDKPREHLIRLI